MIWKFSFQVMKNQIREQNIEGFFAVSFWISYKKTKKLYLNFIFNEYFNKHLLKWTWTHTTLTFLNYDSFD